jgi:ribonucleotide monophosphatase NagD (HAD superfamily)
MVQMRRTILSDSRLKGELEKIGIRFVKNTETENLDMIIPKGFESTTEYRQLQTYIKALHMTTDPEYTNPNTLTNEMRREKMEMFFEIVR